MNYNPAFILKRISHQDILDKYLQGNFKDYQIVKTIKISSQNTVICEEFSKDPYKAIFTIAISKHSNPICVSSNQKAFDVYMIEGSRRTDLPCDWCGEKVSEDALGMVVAYSVYYYIDPLSKKSQKYEIFWVYGNHCDFECAYGELDFLYSNGINHLINCESSIRYTKLLFTRITGKSSDELTPAPYFRLLKSRGGSVDKKTSHKYMQNKNIILAPAKIAFEKLAIYQ